MDRTHVNRHLFTQEELILHDDIIRSQFKKKISNQRQKEEKQSKRKEGRKRAGLYKNEESL